jgi:hypothetical protein
MEYVERNEIYSLFSQLLSDCYKAKTQNPKSFIVFKLLQNNSELLNGMNPTEILEELEALKSENQELKEKLKQMKEKDEVINDPLVGMLKKLP